ncbi:MAG: hypothetical protein A3G81_25990 [Betaproteobacteria bacterium RIFCSPLOWO2_12_FULL_65_14]|nr:MAG: hypothetical protein A3G81_25990 [Betaproteobacteria bacterium RIFCSPLOWO2_12_FULL_65_14]
MNVPESMRLDLALAFAERVIGIGGSATKALKLAAAQYEIDADVLLVEWCRRLIAQAAAEDAITKAAS